MSAYRNRPNLPKRPPPGAFENSRIFEELAVSANAQSILPYRPSGYGPDSPVHRHSPNGRLDLADILDTLRHY